LRNYPDITVVVAPDFGDGALTVALPYGGYAGSESEDRPLCSASTIRCAWVPRQLLPTLSCGRDVPGLVVDGELGCAGSIMGDSNYAATGLNNSDQIGRGGIPSPDGYSRWWVTGEKYLPAISNHHEKITS